MGRRIAILLGAFCLMHFAAVLGGNMCVPAHGTNAIVSAEKVLAAKDCRLKKTLSFSSVSDDLKRPTYRTRIWTQFFLFIVPEVSELPTAPVFTEEYNERYYSAFVAKKAYCLFGQRGPPAFPAKIS